MPAKLASDFLNLCTSTHTSHLAYSPSYNLRRWLGSIHPLTTYTVVWAVFVLLRPKRLAGQCSPSYDLHSWLGSVRPLTTYAVGWALKANYLPITRRSPMRFIFPCDSVEVPCLRHLDLISKTKDEKLMHFLSLMCRLFSFSVVVGFFCLFVCCCCFFWGEAGFFLFYTRDRK